MFGVVNVGEVLNTRRPVPISSPTIAAISAEVSISVETIGSRQDSATPAAVIPPATLPAEQLAGSDAKAVAVVAVAAFPEIDPVADPILGVVNTGEVENTNRPVPVSSVTIPATSADVSISVETIGSRQDSATPAAVIPPATLPAEQLAGSDASAVAVPALPEIDPVADPILGVVNTGDVLNTNSPVPVSSVTIPAISAEVSISVETIVAVS